MRDELRAMQLLSTIGDLDDHIVVCGYGTFGKTVARSLDDAGRDVVVVETQEAQYDAGHRRRRPRGERRRQARGDPRRRGHRAGQRRRRRHRRLEREHPDRPCVEPAGADGPAGGQGRRRNRRDAGPPRGRRRSDHSRSRQRRTRVDDAVAIQSPAAGPENKKPLSPRRGPHRPASPALLDLLGGDALDGGRDISRFDLFQVVRRVDADVGEFLGGRAADARQVLQVVDALAGLVLLEVADGTAQFPRSVVVCLVACLVVNPVVCSVRCPVASIAVCPVARLVVNLDFGEVVLLATFLRDDDVAVAGQRERVLAVGIARTADESRPASEPFDRQLSVVFFTAVGTDADDLVLGLVGLLDLAAGTAVDEGVRPASIFTWFISCSSQVSSMTSGSPVEGAGACSRTPGKPSQPTKYDPWRDRRTRAGRRRSRGTDRVACRP